MPQKEAKLGRTLSRGNSRLETKSPIAAAFATVNYKRVIYSGRVFAPRPDVLNAFVDIAPVFFHVNFERVNKRASPSPYPRARVPVTQALNERAR